MAHTVSTSYAKQRNTRRRMTFLDVISLYRQRRALARLDDHALDDIGVTRDVAEKEARRPFWDFPAN